MMNLSHDERAKSTAKIVAECLRALANKVFGKCVCQVVSLLLLLRNGAQVNPRKTNFQQNFSGKWRIIVKLLILRRIFCRAIVDGGLRLEAASRRQPDVRTFWFRAI
jgi:hypothetical protein